MPASCFRCVLLIARKTYGWNKEKDGIPASQFVKHTGINRRSVLRIMAALVKSKIVLRTSGDAATRSSSTYYINANIAKWGTSVVLATSGRKVTRASDIRVSELVTPRPPSKDMYSKDTITKEHSLGESECETGKKLPENPIQEAPPEPPPVPKPPSKRMTLADFDVFWDGYPRKVGVGLARRRFLTLRKALLPTILEALTQQKNIWEIKATEKRFIPHAATWLNQERWEDEVDLSEDDPGAGLRMK